MARPTILQPFFNPVCIPEGMLFFSGSPPLALYFWTLSMYELNLDMQEGTPRRRSFRFIPAAYWRNFSPLSRQISFLSSQLAYKPTCIRCFLGEAKAYTPLEPVDLKPPSTDDKPKLKSIVNLLDFEVGEALTDTGRFSSVMVNFYRLPERRHSRLRRLVGLEIVYHDNLQ